MLPALVDIHCHLLAGVDGGAADLATSLAMAQLAEERGTRAIIATPRQLGDHRANHGEDLRRQTAKLQRLLAHGGSPLQVLPGALVRIEEGLIEGLASGELLTLADHRQHVLLELPLENSISIAEVLAGLGRLGVIGIVAHPECSEAMICQPEKVVDLVERGLLMQVSAGGLLGDFGTAVQKLTEWMLSQGLVHFVASEGLDVRARRPRMRRAFERVAVLGSAETAIEICSDNPALVAAGEQIAPGRLETQAADWRSWFPNKRAA